MSHVNVIDSGDIVLYRYTIRYPMNTAHAVNLEGQTVLAHESQR